MLGDILKGILTALDSFGELNDEFFLSRKKVRETLYGCGFERKREPKVYYELKKNGYLKEHSSGSVEFTDKARLRIIEQSVSKLQKDDKYRFVSFDVPEYMKNNRDLFRRAIKKMGFRQIQKSLWVCNKDIATFLEAATREYKVQKYVIYIIAEKTDIDGYIAKILDNGE